MQIFHTSHTASSIIALMEDIWGQDTHYLYNSAHDANHVIASCGGKKLYSCIFDDMQGYYWQLPNGEKLKTTVRGCQIRAVKPYHKSLLAV